MSVKAPSPKQLLAQKPKKRTYSYRFSIELMERLDEIIDKANKTESNAKQRRDGLTTTEVIEALIRAYVEENS
jgi:predicted DNA-binding protein